MPYRKTNHPGITVARNRHGKFFARWKDPDTGQTVSEAFSRHGFTTKAQASNWLKSKSREIQLAKQRASVTGPRTNVAASWLLIEDSYVRHFATDRGIEAASRLRRDWLRRFREHLQDMRVEVGGSLNQDHLRSFRTGLATGNLLSPSTRNRTLGSVRAFLSWAIEHEYLKISKDHLRVALKPFQVPRREPRVLNRQELKQLIAAVVEHDSMRWVASRQNKAAYSNSSAVPSGSRKYNPLAPFTLLALLTGARPGEVLALRWDRVDLQAQRILMWSSKTQRERVIPLRDSPALLEFLSALKLRSKGNAHICGDWAGGRPTEIHDRQWRKLMTMAGLDGVTMKVLRSTCIAHVASASTDSEYLLEARFGHRTSVSKRHYRKPLHGLSARGATIEEWLGIKPELWSALQGLGYARGAEPANARVPIGSVAHQVS